MRANRRLAPWEPRNLNEYVLLLERPTTQRLTAYDFEHLAAQQAQTRAAEDERMFAELGLTTADCEDLKLRLAKIYKASLQAGIAMQQLLIARKDYDIRLHELFPDQRYDRYREYELSRKSSGEVSRFRAFLEQQHLTLDSASEVTIARLIRELRTYTQHSWHGPFDGLPQVAVGNDEVVAQLESRTEDLARNGSALLNRAANLGISDSLLTALNDYFSAHINENRARSEQIRRKASTPGGNK